MTRNQRTSRSSTSKKLAIFGALITGTAGISMAVYSIIGGEETGAGALLAASALAFGLLAANVDRVQGSPASKDSSDEAEMADSPGLEVPAGVQSVAAFAGGTQRDGGHVNGGQATRSRPADVAVIDAEPLTDRETQVLSLVAEGNSNKLISATLGISERTVKNHLATTMTKLRASDRTHAVVTAVRLGWLGL